MTKGQRAMAVARIYPEGERGKTPRNLEMSNERIRQACTVRGIHSWLPLLADIHAAVRAVEAVMEEREKAAG